MIEIYSPTWWVSQIIAGVAYSAILISAWSTSRKATITSMGISASLFTVEYVILGLWVPAGTAAINSARAFSLAFTKNRKTRLLLAYIFIFIQILTFIFITGKFNEWLDYLPLLAAIVSTISFSLHSITKIKILSILGGIIWITFAIFNSLWVNVLGDILVIGLTIVALIKVKRFAKTN
jgi:hypothetical protein